jgi:hypothetical protein
MDRLEQYVDRICRRLGGPRSMRAHVRQELKEHLQDAAAEHEGAGMSKEQALEKAIVEFGEVEEVRGELEGAHGQRALAVMVEKAMDWKEKTMKARWLWTTWGHGALALIIALEVVFVSAVVVLLVPKYKELAREGLLRVSAPNELAVEVWLWSFLQGVEQVCLQGWWVALGAVILWGFFEWRVRSENKAGMRMAAMGSVALLMLIVVMLTAAAISLPTIIATQDLAVAPQSRVEQARQQWERALAQMEKAETANDWIHFEAAARQAAEASSSLETLWATGPLMFSTTDAKRIQEIRNALRDSRRALMNASGQARMGNQGAVVWEMKRFREAYERLSTTGTRPASQ